MPTFITHKRGGLIVRHRTLSAARAAAKKEAKKGRDSFVDKVDGRATRNVDFFPAVKKKKLFRRRR